MATICPSDRLSRESSLTTRRSPSSRPQIRNRPAGDYRDHIRIAVYGAWERRYTWRQESRVAEYTACLGPNRNRSESVQNTFQH